MDTLLGLNLYANAALLENSGDQPLENAIQNHKKNGIYLDT